jgi:hypothetical protein
LKSLSLEEQPLFFIVLIINHIRIYPNQKNFCRPLEIFNRLLRRRGIPTGMADWVARAGVTKRNVTW